MPPPIASMPPIAPAPVASPEPHFPPPAARSGFGDSPMAAPAAPGPMAASAAPPSIAPVPSAAPAPVVPLKDSNKSRQPAPIASTQPKPVRGRTVSAVAKRGVTLEPLDQKVVKMLDLQSNILERLRTKIDLDKVPIERLHEEEL